MINPTDEVLLFALQDLYSEQPTLGTAKIQAYLKQHNKDWAVSLRRIARLRHEHGMVPGKGSSGTTLPTPPIQRPSGLFLKNRGLHNFSQSLSEAYRAHHNVLQIHFSKGHKAEECWYPILPEGIETYDYDKVVWIQPSIPGKLESLSWLLLGDYKHEALLGNIAALSMLFRRLRKTLDKVGIHVSDRRLASQLEAEYGVHAMEIVENASALMKAFLSVDLDKERLETFTFEVMFAMHHGALGPDYMIEAFDSESSRD